MNGDAGTSEQGGTASAIEGAESIYPGEAASIWSGGLVMAGLKLDGTGVVKMQTLEDALLVLQRVHGLVEQYAMQVKRNQPAQVFLMNIRRTLPSLSENLKAHFGMISDIVLSVNLTTSRGASDAMRIRAMREGVGQIKQAIEIAMTLTKDKHAVHDETHPKKQTADDA